MEHFGGGPSRKLEPKVKIRDFFFFFPEEGNSYVFSLSYNYRFIFCLNKFSVQTPY